MKKEDPPENIDFHYIKSNDFRVVHADGVWGGATPRGYITMSFYSERHPIPRRLTHKISPNRTLGKETDRDCKEGIIREIEVAVMMDLSMAKAFIPWLNEKITVLEDPQKLLEARKDAQESQGKEEVN